MLHFNIKPIANRTEGTPNALKTMLELAQNAHRTSSYVHIYSGYIYISLDYFAILSNFV